MIALPGIETYPGPGRSIIAGQVPGFAGMANAYLPEWQYFGSDPYGLEKGSQSVPRQLALPGPEVATSSSSGPAVR